jgi:hypothetical protein
VSDRPPFTTLRLRQPRMGPSGAVGELVRAVQRRLEGLEVDGVYGCQTSARVQRWQFQQGSPNTSGAITPAELAVLLRFAPRPEAWAERARLERHDPRTGWRPIPNPVLDRCSDPESATNLRIITRAEVGLRPPRARVGASHGAGVGFVLHWQGPGRGAVGLEAAFRQLRAFQAFHMDTHGWSDIGYSWAIPRGVPRGTVIELRGRGVHGAHCGHAIGNAQPGVLVMLGDQDDGPTADQLATMQAFRRSEHWGKATGHREWSATSCPGPDLWPWVLAHRAA